MRSKFLMMSPFIFGMLFLGCSMAQLKATSMHATKDFVSSDLFQFTISPDDRWLIFMSDTIMTQYKSNKDTFQPSTTSLVVLDLMNDQKFQFIIEGYNFTIVSSILTNNCWTK